MLDTDQQLAQLKQRIAAINHRFAARKTDNPTPLTPQREPRARFFIEQWSDGSVVSNEFGEHFETERLFPVHRPHGSADVGALSELPEDFFDVLSDGAVPAVRPERLAFLDTETTGLAGGTGTYAFLIGVGRIERDGFHVRQFFMREYAEERSLLAALNEHLGGFDVLVTYNGRAYDQPLLETRYRITRHKPPFARMTHLDLLYGARRLWKLRLEDCRLMQLERQILGVEREGDLPGDLIPYVYFEYLRSREAYRLVPIFHHNAMDILTLACLTAIVPAAFRNTDTESLARAGVRRGDELAGIGRWLLAAGESERAIDLLKRAVEKGLPDRLLFRTLWDIALIEKKLGRSDAALAALIEIADCRNDYRVLALEELAKYYEHSERNYVVALEFTQQALTFGPSAALDHRRSRLQRRVSRPRKPRLPD